MSLQGEVARDGDSRPVRKARSDKRRGRQKGRIEGHQEGISEATRQIALAMLNSGLSPATVSKITGLSAQDMAQLQRQA
jgi:predicted transposase/invertase (TIGR01784 family)